MCELEREIKSQSVTILLLYRDGGFSMNTQNIFSTYNLPKKDMFLEDINNTICVLESEDNSIRERDSTGKIGAFIDISSFSLPTVIIPDLHARLDFFNSILQFKYTFDDNTGETLSIFEALEKEKVLVVCVGDGLHAEKRAFTRWVLGEDEWKKGNALNTHMCMEMEEGLGLMNLVMKTKCTFPRHFHFLKGNHENILNEYGKGNLPFRKFSSEGEMVKDFMLKLYGNDVLHAYAKFEHSLPLFVRGSNFLISHAAPAIEYSKKELINAYLDEEVSLGLTWTRNYECHEDAVVSMLHKLLPSKMCGTYFSGHTTCRGTHQALSDGKLIQIHNPNEQFITIVDPNRAFNPSTDIFDTKTGSNASLIIE